MTDGGAGAIELCTSISPVPPSPRELLLAADLMLRSVGFTCHRADASLGGPHFAASRPIRARSHAPPVARLALVTLPRLRGGSTENFSSLERRDLRAPRLASDDRATHEAFQ